MPNSPDDHHTLTQCVTVFSGWPSSLWRTGECDPSPIPHARIP